VHDENCYALQGSGHAGLFGTAASAEPVAVRYAWADNPVVSLYNAEGLPPLPSEPTTGPVSRTPSSPPYPAVPL
jgi:hypothetical protein